MTDTAATLPHLAVVGLGANLGDPTTMLRQAVQTLARHPHTADWRLSPMYRSAPVGTEPGQPDYINAVAICQTRLSAEDFLRWLLDTERRFGRDREQDTTRYAPRTLDLDLLIYDQLNWNSDLLTLPHPRLHERAFVLRPLLDMLPDAHLPQLGRLDQYLAKVADQRITQLAE